MKPVRNKSNWPRVALLAAVACSPAVGHAQVRAPEEPRWMKLRITEVSTGVYAEGRIEETKFDNSDTSVSHNRFFIGPLLGVDANGSIYHPNLFKFIISSEGAFGYAEDKLKTPAGSVRRSEVEYLGRVIGNADIFANKPVRGNIFGDYDHTYRDYDFFTRATVDNSRYGAKIAYDAGPLNVTAGYMHRNEDISSFSGKSTSENDVISLGARHERERGGTTFSYVYDQYDRTDFGGSADGRNHTVSLADSERFGSQNQARLNTSVSYNKRDDVEESDEVFAAANLGLEHRPNLASFYDATYDYFTTEDFDSESYFARAELRHQFYESLTSSLILQGSNFESSDASSDGYTRRYGGGFAEGYVKRLGSNHRVRINNTLLVEHVDQQGFSTVRNERHTFSEATAPAGSFFLNLPDVKESTIVITDQSDSLPGFVRGIDYNITRNGDRVLITRPAGSRIGVADVVLVDYEADASGSGSYEALTETFQIRLEFWNNLWALYNRVNLFQNNAPSDLRVQNLISYAVGTDLNWRFMRVGAEYEVYDADLSEYSSLRFYESFVFHPNESSTFSLDFSQSFTDYTDADRKEEAYRFITRYREAITPRLRLNVEGGVDWRQGEGFDRTLATARSQVEYFVGKTTIKAGYDFEYDLFLDNEERTKHLFFVKARRLF